MKGNCFIDIDGLSLFINFLFISIDEKNWFAESRFFVGVHWMEFADTTLGITEQYLLFCHQTGMVGH